MQTFQGKQGIYSVANSRPFAYGRISVLFEGTDKDGGPVCIKVFRDSPRTPGEVPLLDEFMRELTAQKTLKHPHILPIIDFGEGTNFDPAPFLVLPLCKTGNLRELMKSRDFIPLDEALPILQQIALAIDFAHKAGFVHGDIKPENILFKEDLSHSYLGDFGMAKYFSIVERITSAIVPYIGGGSAAYLSPEQIDKGKQSHSSDIYSFAIVAYELLTGSLPFDVAVPPFKQMQLKVEGKIIDPQEANPVVATSTKTALLKALSTDHKERPHTAYQFCQLLEEQNQIAKIKSPRRKFWASLEPTSKVAIITAIIAALAGIITALIALISNLLKAKASGSN